MQTLWTDLRYGARVLRRNPGFTAVAVLTLALGVGANTAIFSVVDAVLLRPLPYPNSHQLVSIWAEHADHKGERMQLSFPDFEDLHMQATEFQAMDALFPDRWELTGVRDSGAINGVLATPGFFHTLGIQPALGRAFSETEAQPGKDNVILLSWGLWRERFGGDASILGRAIALDGKPYTIIGVLPASFDFTLPVSSSFSISKVQAWRPLSRDHFLAASRDIFTYEVVARLQPSTSLAQSQMQISAIGSRLGAAYPATNRGRTFNAIPLHRQIVGDVRPALLSLFVSTAIVLLIATVNLSNLLLSRSVARAREVAVRAALGAGRLRLVRQFIAENLLLAFIGCGLGVALASWVTSALVFAAHGRIPLAQNAGLDWRVLAFALAAACIVSILFGMIPAWLLSNGRYAGNQAEHLARASAGRGQQAAGRFLLVFEMALACLLLISAGLLMGSFRALLSESPGFEVANLITFQVSTLSERYPHQAETLDFFTRLQSSLVSTPGVESAALVSTVPLSGQNVGSEAQVEGRPLASGEHGPTVGWQMISPGYLRTMAIPLIRGREFTQSDLSNSIHVSLINESMARMLFDRENPLGRRIHLGSFDPKNPDWHVVIGVVRDTRQLALDSPPSPQTYDLFGQHWDRSMYMVVHTRGNVAAVLGAIRNDVAVLDRQMPLDDVRTMHQYLDESLASRRYVLSLILAFASLAILLALVGIYGVFSYSVSRRTREIGIRVAIGAQSSHVLRGVLGDAMKLALEGIALGTAASFWLTRLLASQLYGISARDPKTLALVAITLLLAAVAASYIPARRAMRVDPTVTLRHE